MRHLRVALAPLAMLVLLAACTPRGAESAGDTIAIRVVNNAVPSSALSVYLMPENGVRRFVGSVSPNQTKVLRVSPGRAALRYVLVARTTSGAEITSIPFTIGSSATTVSWTLASNIVTVDQER